MSDSATPWTGACQASLSITNSWSLFKLIYMELVMPSNHLIFCHPLVFLLSIFPSIRVFSSKSVLCIRWPKYWSFSFIVSLSSDFSGLISFRIDGLISLLSKELSRVFSSTTVWGHQFFSFQPFLLSSSHFHTSILENPYKVITYTLKGQAEWCGKWKCIHAHIFICPTSLCLLVGAFNPFAFKVIINIYDLITIFLIVWGLSSVGLILFLCFLPREVRLEFVVKLVWWCWILLTFSYLETFWYLY